MRRHSVEVHEAERRLREAALRYLPAMRLELLRILMFPAAGRAAESGRLHADEATRSLAELLIDCEVDRRIGPMVVDALKESLPPSKRLSS